MVSSSQQAVDSVLGFIGLVKVGIQTVSQNPASKPFLFQYNTEAVAQLVEQRSVISLSRNGSKLTYFWLLTRRSQVRTLSASLTKPIQNDQTN